MCPLCSSRRVRRSRRRPLDLVLLLVGAQPMRCRTCSNRYFRWLWQRTEGDTPQLPPESRERSVAVGTDEEPLQKVVEAESAPPLSASNGG